MDVIIAVAALVCAGVLGVSLVATRRSGGVAGLTTAVSELDVVPTAAARPVAVVVVGWEAALVVALLLPVRAAIPLTAAALLFAGYAVALTLAVRHGSRGSCHCFGSSGTPVAPRHA